ncbi:polyadenylate-binding protein 2-B-like isoform X2 [Babylonia areolata]|uniref:polyadenylate-binding protein 2-B-like isoform X2 n=1 Tax=Babylonia areolata TaxID=304850 RepID=UPI003FD509F1
MAGVENGMGAMEESFSLTDVDGNSTGITEDSGVEDPELEAIKARVREMEEEAEKLKKMQNEVEKQMNLSSPTPAATSSPFPSQEEKIEADTRSIYVGNVDYGATAEELEQHFHGCGSVNRVTILCDKFSGHPKGFAYVEFADKDSVVTAMALDESLFRGRQIKVNPKRTNRPGISSTNRGRARSRGGRGRGYGSGSYGYGGGFVPGGFTGGYTPRARRGYGRYRGRANYYSPY